MDPILPTSQPAATPSAPRHPLREATSTVQQVANRPLAASPAGRSAAQSGATTGSVRHTAPLGTGSPNPYAVESRARADRALAAAEMILATRRAKAPRCLSTIEAALAMADHAAAGSTARASAAADLLHGLFGPAAPLAGQLAARDHATTSPFPIPPPGADPACHAARQSASESAIDAYRQFVQGARSSSWFVAHCSSLDAACARFPAPDFTSVESVLCKEIVATWVQENTFGVTRWLNRVHDQLFGCLVPLSPKDTCAVARANYKGRAAGAEAQLPDSAILTPESEQRQPRSVDRWRDVVLDAAQRAMEDATGRQLADGLHELRKQAAAGADGHLQAAARDLIDFAEENAVYMTPDQAEALAAGIIEVFASIDPELKASADTATADAQAVVFDALESAIVPWRHPIAWTELRTAARACVPPLSAHGRVTARLEALRSELADIPADQQGMATTAEKVYLQEQAKEIYEAHGLERARLPFARWDMHSHLESLAEYAEQANWDAAALFSSLALEALHSMRDSPGGPPLRYDLDRHAALRHIAICLSRVPDDVASHRADHA